MTSILAPLKTISNFPLTLIRPGFSQAISCAALQVITQRDATLVKQDGLSITEKWGC